MSRRIRYTFMGRSGNRLVWQRRIPGDSRVDQITCSADWFYTQMRKPS